MNYIVNPNAEILESKNDSYDISVCIITYNKEEYIKETIDSVLMQQTTCSYEIVVGDNFSTDNTRTILREYWRKHQDKCTIIFNDKNLGLTTNMYNTLMKAKGKYIIILYGDDFWIYDKRLQEQYDFLQTNEQYIGVTSVIENRYSGESKGFKYFPNTFMRNKPCTLKDYMNGFDFPMAGLMFRNEVFTRENEHFKKMLQSSLYIDDLSFCILVLMKGNVYILPQAMGVYRCFRKDDNAGNFNSVNPKIKRNKMSIELLNNLDSLTGNILDLDMRYGLVLASSFMALLKGDGTKDDYKKLISEMSVRYQKRSVLLLLKGIYRKINLAIVK